MKIPHFKQKAVYVVTAKTRAHNMLFRCILNTCLNAGDKIFKDVKSEEELKG